MHAMGQADLSPADAALARLGSLTAAGTPPERVIQAVGEIVAGWAGEPDMNPEIARARTELLWDSVSKDAAELEEQIGDASGPDTPGLGEARRVLAAMQAAVAALAAVHERL